MKNLGIGFIALLFIALVSSCSKKCENEQPRARVLNNGTSSVSVGIKTSNGNTVNINNVAPQTATDYASYAPGKIIFTITITLDGTKTDKVKEVEVGTCYDYDIAIDASNVITVNAINRNK